MDFILEQRVQYAWIEDKRGSDSQWKSRWLWFDAWIENDSALVKCRTDKALIWSRSEVFLVFFDNTFLILDTESTLIGACSVDDDWLLD